MTRHDHNPTLHAIAATFAFTTALVCMDHALGQEGAYKPPPTPIPVAPGVPALLADMDVDDFIRVIDARGKYRVSGRHLSVAVIDTGLNAGHVDFRGKIIPGKNFSNAQGADNTQDLDGHGSNVAGIIAGREVDPHEDAATRSMHTGIAPDAMIVPLKVFPGGRFDQINKALQWVLDNASVHQIGVVNMSLGSDENLQNVSSVQAGVLKQQMDLIRQLRDKNIAVTVAAGNNFFEFNPGQGMGFPAICKETVSVGALFPKNQQPDDGPPLRRYRDGSIVNFAVLGRCTPFSQRLSTAAGGDFRTDVFAPGFNVTSAGPSDPAHPDLAKQNQTIDDGTSQAAPVVAGVILLLQEYYRVESETDSLPSVDLIEECLRSGGQDFVDLNDPEAMRMANVKSTGATFSRLNALAALKYLDAKLKSSMTRDQAVAVLQKRYTQLMGGTAAPEEYINDLLAEPAWRGRYVGFALTDRLDKLYRRDVMRLQSKLLEAAPEEREAVINGSTLLDQKLESAR